MHRTAAPHSGYLRYVARKSALQGSLLMALAVAYLVPHEMVAAHADQLRGREAASITTASPQPAAARAKVNRLMAKYECSRTGLADGAVPATAIVVDHAVGASDVQAIAADAHLTSFAKGWQVLQGKRPGTLIAVCALDRRQAP